MKLYQIYIETTEQRQSQVALMEDNSTPKINFCFLKQIKAQINLFII